VSIPAVVERRPSGSPLLWIALGGLSALAVGLASALDVIAALGVAIAIAVALITAMRPSIILAMLSISISLELVSFGGVNISRLLAPVALLVVLLELIRGKASVRWSAPIGWVVAYALWAIASGFWTVSIAGTVFLLSSLAVALVYMVAFAALLDSRRELERILYIFALASLFVGALTFLAFFREDQSGGLQEGRSQGGTGDPSFFAAYQLVALPLVLTLAAHAKQRWLRLGLYVAVLAIIGSLFTSLSRGAFIALAVLIPLILALPARAFFRSSAQKQFLLLLVVLAGTSVVLLAPTQVITRVESIYAEEGSDTQGSGRLNLWLAAEQSIRDHPVLGVGYGSFRYISNDLLLQTPGVDLEHYEIRDDGAEAHNLYLGTAAELGLPGLILYLGIMASTAAALRRTARRAFQAGEEFLGRVANALVLSLVAWAIASIFISTETTRAFWILVGLSLALPKLIPEQARVTEPAQWLPSRYVPGSAHPAVQE
jgi:O-antigen ligase